MISSPLRYPGGKAKLYPFFAELIKINGLIGTEYCEPYAGGAGLAIRLLASGFAEKISINDIDRSIYAFWFAALHLTQDFCNLIRNVPVTVQEWYNQKKVWLDSDISDPLTLGFATFFLNRTNRSGIIEGAGPIGGYSQLGKWKIDVRFVQEKQIENILALSRYREQISISNLDALEFLEMVMKKSSALIYLDPPYYIKGSKLYKNFYRHEDHVKIASEMKRNRSMKWIVSYDDVPEVRTMYSTFEPITYSLNYSAGEKGLGTEVIFTSDAITSPVIEGFSVAA